MNFNYWAQRQKKSNLERALTLKPGRTQTNKSMYNPIYERRNLAMVEEPYPKQSPNPMLVKTQPKQSQTFSNPNLSWTRPHWNPTNLDRTPLTQTLP